MDGKTRPCPSCGAPLPDEASFCPHCAENIRSRQAVKAPAHRWWRRWLIRGVLLTALALAAVMLYDYVAPDVYDAWGELTYTLNSNDYRLFLTFRSDATPESEYTVQVEEGGSYDRASKLFITHVASGVDAGRMFNQQTDSIQVRVLQPPDSPSPVICHAPTYAADPRSDGLLVAQLDFTDQSRGPVEVEWTIRMKNGDTILLRQTMNFEPVDTIHYYPEDYDMDTIEDLQALVDQIQEEVPLPTVVRLHLPPVHYAGGLTIDRRAINLSGSVDEKNMRTAFLGPVVLSPEGEPLCVVENIDFRGSGAGTGLMVASQYRIQNCAFIGWDTGLLVGGDAWADPVGCLFEDNDVGFRFDSAGNYVNYTNFHNNTFLRNGIAVDLAQVPGSKSIDFAGCRFSGNETAILNPTGHSIDTSHITFE